ncbi:FliM/FliN family flagellar motor switch protein [Sandaracinobacteroides saxicola]|uniref:Flagellar motor switch protein FliM n=1 Tax=Sandaracinobacteroides saxicola TaxID=2759707 RepID=A0A7G5IK19_9SPHN|nr:FliM/FliN family flagellar motor switch protein [Sandaracinobacteroides saxicola]QMW23711.1 FliM/FliN family flagellar motor switch protein [Sandaracinobacteroides saxicola]
MMAGLLEKLARTTSTAFRNAIGDSAELRLTRFATCRFEEVRDQPCPPCVFAIGHVTPWETRILIRMEATIVKSAVHAMMGGARKTAPSSESASLSAIERGFGQYLAAIILEQLERMFDGLAALRCMFERIEHDVHLAAVIPTGTGVLIADFALELLGSQGTMTIILPLAPLEPLRPILSQPFVEGQLNADDDWRVGLQVALDNIELPLEVEIATITLPLVTIERLKKGDTLTLPGCRGQRASLKSAGQTVADGRLFSSRGIYTLLLDPSIHPSCRSY